MCTGVGADMATDSQQLEYSLTAQDRRILVKEFFFAKLMLNGRVWCLGGPVRAGLPGG